MFKILALLVGFSAGSSVPITLVSIQPMSQVERMAYLAHEEERDIAQLCKAGFPQRLCIGRLGCETEHSLHMREIKWDKYCR